MGGEGAMMHMITSLKNNKRRRKKLKSFGRDIVGSYGNERPIYDFPEATPEVLAKIKSDFVKEQKMLRIKTFVVSILIVGIVIYLLI